MKKTILSVIMTIFILMAGIGQTVNATTTYDTSKWKTYEITVPTNPTIDSMKAISVAAPDNILAKIDGLGGTLTPEKQYIDIALLTEYGWDNNLYYRHYYGYSSEWDEYFKVLSVDPNDELDTVTVKYYVCQFKGSILLTNSIETEDRRSVSHDFYTALVQFKTPIPTPTPTPAQTVKIRLGGIDRIKTSLLIANNYNSGKVDNIVLATGNNFPDSLSGSVLAKKLNAPILLIGNSTQKAEVYSFIKSHLNAGGKVTILGGSGVIGNDVISSIKSLGFLNIERLGGIDRFSTNSQIYSKLNVSQGTPIVIATAYNFPDALGMSSISSMKGYPIILSNQNSLPQAAINYINKINPQTIYIAGGTGVISDNVLNAIKGYNVVRLGGSTRYDTSLKIANYFQNEFSNTVSIATGSNFPDALAGSILSAKESAPILLVNSSLSSYNNYLTNKKINKYIIYGGTGVVSTAIENEIR